VAPAFSKDQKALLSEAEKLTGIKPELLRWSGKHPVMTFGNGYQMPMPTTPSDHRSRTNWLALLTRELGKVEPPAKKKRHRTKPIFRYGALHPQPQNLGADLKQAMRDAGHRRVAVCKRITDAQGTHLGPGTITRIITVMKEGQRIGAVLHDGIKKYIREFAGESLSNKYGGRILPEPVELPEPVVEAKPEPVESVEELIKESNGQPTDDELLDFFVQLRPAEKKVLATISQAMVEAKPLAARILLLVHDEG
jgi:hypothetical protein|tara:strand:- start:1366 stop:2121 length:756 start_codon:yes stop_codon:yes gene_type:complete